MRVIITGATGLLGRNLLFEFLRQAIVTPGPLELFVLGRGNDDKEIAARMEQIVLDDGAAYLAPTGISREDLRVFSRSFIRCVNLELDKSGLEMVPEDLRALTAKPIDMVFHVAAMTDFRDSPQVVAQLTETNIEGTKRILQLMECLTVGEFCYVGSAYSCGLTSGSIQPDYVNVNQPFRNPYEKTKLLAEIEVRNFAKRSGVRCRFFRPSTLCGRLLEQPLGATHKFDVFYAWVAFFLYLKSKALSGEGCDYGTPVHLPIRLCCSERSGANIVPVDFAAKVMREVCLQGAAGRDFHLVNNQETPHYSYVSWMLETVNVRGTTFVPAIPGNLNRLETFYYRTIGNILTPYGTNEPTLFDTHNLQQVLAHAKLECPSVDRKNFMLLMDFAKQFDFGIKGG
jgi:nucleoside-diphosphate-sugar epimerase